MMLNKSSLVSGILEIFTVPYEPATMTEFAKKLTKVYTDYAKKGMSYAGNPIVSESKTAMESVLYVLDSPANSVAIFASTVEQSVIAYWGTVTFAVFPFPPGFGLVNLVTHTNPKQSSIQPGFIATTLAPSNAQIKAQSYADILHSATLGVMTSHFGLDITLLVPKSELDKPIM